MVRFVADENIDRAVVEVLRETWDVSYVAEQDPGLSDNEVLDRCEREQALLLTADKDFGDLVFRRGRAHHGVVLLRFSGLASSQKAALVRSVLDAHVEEMKGKFTVVTSEIVRIRKAPGGR